MNITLVGYGAMGRLIKESAVRRGHRIRTVDPASADADFKRLDAAALEDADMCIDFSAPAATLDNIAAAAEFGCSIVVGTTGWYARLDEARRIVAASRIGFLYGSNFSIGVNLFYRIVRHAAALINRFGQYDVSGLELHHHRKADSPSGTAQTLADILLSEVERKRSVVYERCDRRILPEELHFASLRCGNIPGTHEIIFDAEEDSISLKHAARSRAGFAAGAVAGAEWLRGRSGFFTVDQFMESFIGAITPGAGNA